MENNLQNKIYLVLKILIFIICIAAISNLIYVDLFIFKNSKPKNEENKIVVTPNPTPDYADQACPNSCLSAIYQSTKSPNNIPQVTVPTITPDISVSKNPSPTTVPTASVTSQIKEFYISFGSGTNSSGDWEDVGGLKTSIDSSNFPSIKSAVFEASVSIPTGNQTAYARLFNETDKHPVWYSDVSLDGGIPQLLVSKPITLDSGNKTYKIQMKTSLKYQAVLNQARIHIIVK
jgi:hypothetical protein